MNDHVATPLNQTRRKTALVTGAATGIGEALTKKLAEENWQVYAGYRNSSPDKAAWSGMANVTPLKCDVVNREEVFNAAQRIRDEQGRLDLLVNNAAYASNAGVLEAPDMEDYRKTMEVNFWGPMNVIQACVPLLKLARGRIVNTGSASVYLTIPMGSAYPVSKTALTALSHHLRLELAPFGVQVTTLHPGGVATPMTALGSEVADRQWQSIPEPLRDDYARHFRDGASAVGNNFRLYAPEEFARRVYQRVIMAPRLKPSYLIGPGVAPLPWLHRLLPVQQVLNIWARMFAARPA
ncbi:MAG: SDR family NAD(P)-dependent oxidoreductase [Ketobacteraceae bacterium]|nr:SDR family NAD(P)-dependent oxidoreductase [Ketobacteraceae bacterium]